jgi:hypothetical protein
MKNFKRIPALFILLFASVFTATASDKCHVYLIDIEKSDKLSESVEKALSAGEIEKAKKIGEQYVTMFEEFETTFEEEETTTKVYKIPGSNLFITASVFYTDEMLPGNSITLALAIAGKSFGSAMIAPPIVQTDVIYNHSTGTIRAKTFTTINKKSFAVGLQCDCNQP